MIVLVRHGETATNRQRRLLGRDDPPLTDRGRAQAAALATALERVHPVAVVTSPLSRCVETASVVAARCSVEPEVEERLVEIDYGEWDGASLEEISPETSDRWRTDAGFTPPGGESLAQVSTRVGSWCADEAARDRGPVVAVTHVSPIKAAVTWALGVDPVLSWRMFVGLASITRIAFGDSGPVLVSFNERSHLPHDVE